MSIILERKAGCAMIFFTCPGCDRPLSSPANTAGSTFQCPECGAFMRVPVNDPTEPMAVLPDLATSPFPHQAAGREEKP